MNLNCRLPLPGDCWRMCCAGTRQFTSWLAAAGRQLFALLGSGPITWFIHSNPCGGSCRMGLTRSCDTGSAVLRYRLTYRTRPYPNMRRTYLVGQPSNTGTLRGSGCLYAILRVRGRHTAFTIAYCIHAHAYSPVTAYSKHGLCWILRFNLAGTYIAGWLTPNRRRSVWFLPPHTPDTPQPRVYRVTFHQF